MSFQIVFNPPIRPAEEALPPQSLEGVELSEEELSDSDALEVAYKVSGNNFGYYPAAIATVLNDIYLEWDLVRARKSHMMTLSGYPVLEMTFDDDVVHFFKAAFGKRERINGAFAATDVEQAFAWAAAAIWSHIRTNRNSALM